MGGGSGTSITLDLGDDGGNDSTALSEIATANDDYGVVTEPSADKMLIDFAKVAPYRKYDPDRPPSSLGTGGIADEFIGGPSLTWRSKNLGSGTLDYQLDAARFIPPTGTFPGSGLPVHWTTGPDGSATDWVMTGKFTAHPVASFNQVWMMVLVAGTEATPTSIYGCKFTKSATGLEFNLNGWITATSYTSASTGDVLIYVHKGPIPFWLQLRYVSSTKVLTCAYSADGMTFYDFHTFAALSAHPTTSMGWGGMANNASTTFTTRLHYFRVRTDATGTTAPYPCGE